MWPTPTAPTAEWCSRWKRGSTSSRSGRRAVPRGGDGPRLLTASDRHGDREAAHGRAPGPDTLPGHRTGDACVCVLSRDRVTRVARPSSRLLVSSRHGYGSVTPHRPLWSPNGRSIAFITKHQLRVVDVASGRFRVVTRSSTGFTDPGWSPSGRRLYFAARLPAELLLELDEDRAARDSVSLGDVDGLHDRGIRRDEPASPSSSPRGRGASGGARPCRRALRAP